MSRFHLPAIRARLRRTIVALGTGVCLAAVLSATARAAPPEAPAEAPTIIVTGRETDLIGIAGSASEGITGQVDLQDRPIQRVAELLETIPGFIAMQHSGGGKANQYFLRGFNLDHGTDFAVFHDGVPVNMRTHGHGQGYLDINFVIPELVDQIAFAKGPYRADVGDFATAGSARIRTVDRLDAPFVSLEAGTDDYYRLVAAGSGEVGRGTLLLGIEARYDDGPFDLKQHLKLFSGFGKWTGPLGGGTLRASLTGFTTTYRSSEQLPERLITSGAIGRFASLDDDLGGDTTRIGAVLRWAEASDTPLNLLAYGHLYDFELISNFTYFLDDPVNGDEFAQRDRRFVTGGRIDKHFDFDPGIPVSLLIGGEARADFIDRVGLYRTQARQILSTVREDLVTETSGALFAEATLRPTATIRVLLGARADLYGFNVRADLPENSGDDSASIVSPKATIAWAPVKQLELYANYGRGFHSNDARGTSINIDPNTGDAASRVDPLVAGTGYEVGVRLQPIEGLTLTATRWWLDLDSELLFVGDGGTTEPQGPSKRRGYEFSAFYKPAPWLTIDGEFTKSQGRLADLPRGTDRIPGAIEEVIAGGITVRRGGFSASARIRHFGSYSVIEDDSVRSDPTTVVNAQAGYQLGRIVLAAGVLNLFDSRDNEITYFYASRLPGEPADGIEDRHVKPIEPRQLRVSATVSF